MINAEWARLTGHTPGSSTLPNRYNRLKANLSSVDPADNEKLKQAVRTVDAAIEAEHKDAIAKKWTRIAQQMQESGGVEEYSVCHPDLTSCCKANILQAATLEKHWKKLAAEEKAAAPEREDSAAEVADDEVAGGDSEEMKIEAA